MGKPITDSNHITLPLFTQNIFRYFCGYVVLIESTKLVSINHLNGLNGFLTARDLQFHFDEANWLEGIEKKSEEKIKRGENN